MTTRTGIRRSLVGLLVVAALAGGLSVAAQGHGAAGVAHAAMLADDTSSTSTPEMRATPEATTTPEATDTPEAQTGSGDAGVSDDGAVHDGQFGQTDETDAQLQQEETNTVAPSANDLSTVADSTAPGRDQ